MRSSAPRRRLPARTARALVGAALLVSAVLAGCGRVGGPTTHRTVRVVTTVQLGAPDTWSRVGEQQDLLLRNVFQTLLTVGPDGGEPQNDLAESCRFSAPTAYTCRLKEAGFPDGTPVRPADVEWTFVGRRGLGADEPPAVARLHRLIRSVETVDDYTFTFDLTNPDPELPYLLTLPAAGIVRAGSDPHTSTGAATSGSGPYRVESATGSDVVLVANPHYSSAGSAGNDRVEIHHVSDSAAAMAAVTDGSADVFYPGGSHESDALVAGVGTEVTRGADTSTTMLALDQVLPEDSQQPLRQALAALLDRKALARAAGGTIVPMYSAVPSDAQWSTGPALEDDGPDPARAAELLRGAGVTTPVTLPITRPPWLNGALWDELVRQLGDGGLFEPKVAEQTTDFGGSGALVVVQSPVTTDPFAYLALATNIDRSTPLVEQIVRAGTDVDLASREKTAIDLQQELADRSFAIPLWQPTLAVVTRPGVERVSVSPFLRLWLLRPPR
jgi:peptide/nickel transport system substrate-binding protein